MILEHKREELSKNAAFTTVIDSKFKTNSWRVVMCLNQKDIDGAGLFLASAIISSCNSKYKSESELNSKLNTLYGADVYSSISRKGDICTVTIGADTIDDKYALSGEKLSEETVKILIDCIFSPLVENDGFEEKIFKIKKKDALDTVQSEINDKRKYLFLKANSVIFDGEVISKPIYNSYEDVESLTPQRTLKAWNDFVKKASTEIFFVGAYEPTNINKIITDSFSNISSENVEVKFLNPSLIKGKAVTVTEELEVSQSKFAIVFKTDEEDKYTMRMLNLILGGIPSSKLFMNVREKQSLCYYCASSYNSFKRTLFIECGVDEGNEQKAIDAVLEQLEEIKKGNITEQELDAAFATTDNTLKGLGDFPGSYMNWYFDRWSSEEETSVSRILEKYHSVTAEKIKSAAEKLKSDTIYIIKPKNLEC